MMASDKPVRIPRVDFEAMLGFVHTVWRLKQNPAYAQALRGVLPAVAGIDPGAPGILMGYDFHLTEHGPKLIEINNNAGGLYMGNHLWLPQPDLSCWDDVLVRRLCRMFPEHWRQMAIMDEAIAQQFMYPEMQAYAEILGMDGRKVLLLDPEDIRPESDGLYAGDLRLDGIYNRHTDFYLESPQLRHIRLAFEQGLVQINPHPRSYALLGDKGRMVDWWRTGFLEALLSPDEVDSIRGIVPETRRLCGMDSDTVWAERSAWVFKPAARHGGKGVVIGKGISRKRFAELEPDDTVMQRYVQASEIELNGASFRLDIRLFTHGPELIALAGRVWQGQMTNFRGEGSGWVMLELVDS